MTYEDKKRVRAEISKDKNWVVVDGILGENVSPLYWDKEVEIIYQDMDDRPCMCNAIYKYGSYSSQYFVATNGPAKGNRMCCVIAYRPFKEKEGEKE